MNRVVRLSIFAVVAMAAFTMVGCSATKTNQYIWPEYKTQKSCENARPYLIPKRNACDVLPPPCGPWYFERGPAKRASYK